MFAGAVGLTLVNLNFLWAVFYIKCCIFGLTPVCSGGAQISAGAEMGGYPQKKNQENPQSCRIKKK